MRFAKVLLAGSVVVALAGCDGQASTPPSSSLSPSAATTGPEAPPPSPASPKMQATARTAAEQFYGLYLSSQFAASWDLLAPAAKRQISRNTWVKVHNGCSSANAGTSGVIKSVTVFGNAAIVTEAITGATSTRRTVEAVFNYAHGRWGYSPGDMSIYKHGSVSADIAAAGAAGYCAGRNGSTL